MQRWTTYVELRYEQRRIDQVPGSPLRVGSSRSLCGFHWLHRLPVHCAVVD
jgi:hypothetical protein